MKRPFVDSDSDGISVLEDGDSGRPELTKTPSRSSATVKENSFLASDSDEVDDEEVTIIKEVPRKPRSAEFISESPELVSDADLEDCFTKYPILR